MYLDRIIYKCRDILWDFTVQDSSFEFPRDFISVGILPRLGYLLFNTFMAEVPII